MVSDAVFLGVMDPRSEARRLCNGVQLAVYFSIRTTERLRVCDAQLGPRDARLLNVALDVPRIERFVCGSDVRLGVIEVLVERQFFPRLVVSVWA